MKTRVIRVIEKKINKLRSICLENLCYELLQKLSSYGLYLVVVDASSLKAVLFFEVGIHILSSDAYNVDLAHLEWLLLISFL